MLFPNEKHFNNPMFCDQQKQSGVSGNRVFWLKPAPGYILSPLAKANGNDKVVLLSLPSHLCDGLITKVHGFSQKAAIMRIGSWTHYSCSED